MHAHCARRLTLLLAALALVLFAGQARAGVITYQAEYLVLSAETCFTICFPTTTGGTFQETFTLTSSQLAIDGSYDVTSSLSPSFVLPGWTIGGYTADAKVAGGAVTDLAIGYSATAETTNPLFSSFSNTLFTASGGSWSRSDSTVTPGLSSNSDSSSGTYTIQPLPAATPEPMCGVLTLGGAALLSILRRKRRV